MSERATKHDFLTLLRGEIIDRYAGEGKTGIDGWANDAVKLDRFMDRTGNTINGDVNLVSIDSPSFVAAWRGMGLKGKPTFKGLRALPTH